MVSCEAAADEPVAGPLGLPHWRDEQRHRSAVIFVVNLSYMVLILKFDVAHVDLADPLTCVWKPTYTSSTHLLVDV